MVKRLISGILAVVFLPLAVVFVILGLLMNASDTDEGDPKVFLYIGLPFLIVGLGCAIVFFRSWRIERARRARRRAGLRATAEVVSAEIDWRVRVNGRPAFKLTVSFAGNTVSGTFLAGGNQLLKPGSPVDVLYDPAEPSNFEPAPA